ncbi:hypothetical protein [Amycolatopsis sp. YIM 10]|uniref:hypothetical protein n=1 Tax=Amycolatopsis sp. YIM 10 TaxID=2653857 RepID=UPI00128FF985|nr:hypothetical protein [Amycolatopsis sp. YIM 10]QFU87896.1 hypothetical protein YIM_13550 [Amycolatopsis sp. YIM 10]QFU94791.1 hypothetical protein YIM_48330 [Amycolatopsis sp. YIM 10]
MAIDSKYGPVSIPGSTIAADEPVFVLRGQDRLAPDAMRAYLELCKKAGVPQHHLDALEQSIVDMVRWQANNYTQTPRSAGAGR